MLINSPASLAMACLRDSDHSNQEARGQGGARGLGAPTLHRSHKAGPLRKEAQGRGHLLLTPDSAATQDAKDSSTHFPIGKRDLVPTPKGNENWTWREEGGKRRSSS